MINKVKEILAVRMKINDEDCYSVENCRKNLIAILSIDECITIEILKQLNENEILYVSEVFEEIAFNLKSSLYIKCLEKIQKKYSHLDLANAIETARDFI